VKKITFNSVSIENFLSIGETPIAITFNKGVNVITGENKDKGGKNGIGKSTIADAIFWCLFGNTIRELKKSEIQHNKNKKECKVVLNFSIKTEENETNYSLIRILSPSSLKILRIDEQEQKDLTLSTIPETDKYIQSLIGANEEVFNNAVIMSINNTIPFMAQKKTEKRKFIEGILNLSIFGEMLLKSRSEYNDIKKENDILSNDFVSEQRILENLNNSKANFDDSKQERIKVFNEKIKTTSNDLEFLKNQDVKDIKSLKEEIKKHNEHVELLREALKLQNQKTVDIGKVYSEYYDKVRDAKNDKKKILDKGDTCPTCNRKYCDDDLDHVAKEISKLDKIIEENEPYLEKIEQDKRASEAKSNKITDKIESIKDKIKDVTEQVTISSLHEQKTKSLINKIEEYRENIREIEIEVFKDDDKIKKCEKQIKKIEENLSEVKKQLAILDTVKYVVSEEGVKTFIVKKIIEVLNNRLNFYLQKLNAPCKCTFDETFEETLFNDQNKECSYFNFSGGERKRIDTAILFTFQDVLRYHSGISYSLNIYDELFDCALDSNGVDKIIEILKEKIAKYDESIYIISHKNSEELSNIDSVLFLEKSNGTTKLLS
jgi:DNA repair exonuclease SbcCD ATPase subunit